MKQKWRTYLSILGLLGIFCVFLYAKYSYDNRMDKIDNNGAKTYGYIDPYKGSRIIRYHYYVNTIKYKGTRKPISGFPCNSGDVYWVEYEIGNPENERLLLKEGSVKKSY